MSGRLASRSLAVRRLAALVRKESLQVLRDPSAILIAFVLPVLLLFLFAYAVSLDLRKVPIGVVLESDGASARSLAAAYGATRYFRVTPARDRRELQAALVGGELRGFVVIPQDFERRLRDAGAGPLVQVITDGSQPNTANFVAGYAEGVITQWAASRNIAPVAESWPRTRTMAPMPLRSAVTIMRYTVSTPRGACSMSMITKS